MASVPCTYALGRIIELGDLPRTRDGLGSDSLLLALFKSLGAATDTTLRNCATYAAMLTEGAVECDFTNYAVKVLGPADRTIGYVTASSPYKATLTINQQMWNPAGGAVNNTAIVKSVLLYRPTTATPIGSCLPLGICDASGGATGGTYSHTFGVLTDQAT